MFIAPNVAQLVDTQEYVRDNCYQHQLQRALFVVGRTNVIDTIQIIVEPSAARAACARADCVVSTLRVRTLARALEAVAAAVGDRPFTVYDQDPWESFRVGGACVGLYTRIREMLPQTRFAVTTRAWAKRLAEWGFKSEFVRMGIIPSYCASFPAWSQRTIDMGFIGSIHPYRRQLFDSLTAHGHVVDVRTGGLSHMGYLEALSDIRVFVHREEYSYRVEHDCIAATIDYAEGLWIKDVEAAARGCLSVRNHHDELVSYVDPEQVQTIETFHDIDELVEKLAQWHRLPESVRIRRAERAVEWIKSQDEWTKTAQALVAC